MRLPVDQLATPGKTGTMRSGPESLRRAPQQALHIARTARVLTASGLLRPQPPLALLHGALAVVRDGVSPAAAYAYGAARHPDRAALVDDRGTVTFAEAAERSGDLAARLAGAGVSAGDPVALLCRNHRTTVLTVAALASLGADVVLLNAAAAPAEVAEAAHTAGATLLVHDPDLPAAQAAGTRRILTWSDRSGSPGPDEPPTLDDLPTATRPPLRLAPRPGSRYVLLTSGTTGRPKGTGRRPPVSLDPLVALLSRIPLRTGDTTLIAPPLFHAWGFGNLALALGLSATVVLRRRFDAEATLAAVAEHRVQVLVAVPAMLAELVGLPASVRRRYDTSSLRVIASSGAALPGDLATRVMDGFGDVLYNVYGSTEAAWAAIAIPAELRSDPHTAGRAPAGTDLRVVDADGAPVAPGQPGRILVGNVLAATPGRLVDTGDIGRLGTDGLLRVDGREDDMIVSGGENLYPQEVEDVLLDHPDVAEVVVVGRPDPVYGQRVHAVVVATPGRTPTADELRAFAGNRLARFKVPRSVEIVETIPRTATGKPLRRHLVDPPTGAGPAHH